MKVYNKNSNYFVESASLIMLGEQSIESSTTNKMFNRIIASQKANNTGSKQTQALQDESALKNLVTKPILIGGFVHSDLTKQQKELVMTNLELIALIKKENELKKTLYHESGESLQYEILTKILGVDYDYNFSFYPYFEVTQVDKGRDFILREYDGIERVQYLDQVDIFKL